MVHEAWKTFAISWLHGRSFCGCFFGETSLNPIAPFLPPRASG
jgi:hypothetical protein